MKMEKNYNVGLDIGVGSVGWCVTDKDNNIMKKSGKNMWGSRIFEEAHTAEERRNFRAAKRRLSRRKERINILQSLIIDDMEKEYPNFFPRLRETALKDEDKKISQEIDGKKYNIFSENELLEDKYFTDKTYFKKYPTIYHLRNYLVNTNEKVDIRLVYLAIHHIIKYRGNFLYDGNFTENTNEVSGNLNNILNYLNEKYQINLKKSENDIFDILIQKNISKAKKKEELISCFEYDKTDKQVVVNLVNSFLGYSFDLNKIFEIEIEKYKISFALEVTNEEEIKNILQENADLYENMHTIYSWYILQDILNGRAYISESFVDKYDKYANDLKLLKEVYKKYFKEEYKAMFREEGENNYVAYNGKNCGKTCKKCKPEEFFKMLKSKIDKLPDNAKEKQKIKSDLEEDNFLKKINVTDNGAIPHQLHERELVAILENQAKYYETLKENKDKTVKLFNFRIPYYIGPLSKENGKWSWIIRENKQSIRPWNFEEVVNEDATAEEFIKRMTNKCTYLINEDVMPKQSLMYSKFCVLNELNNIKINDRHIARDTKLKIIETLFMNKKKITATMLKDFLKHEALPNENITGLSDNKTFNSNMEAYVDLKRILGKIDEDNFEECENIIYWITIFEEKKILKRKIMSQYKELTQEQVNQLLKLKYTGWSRLSKKLICGLKSTDNQSIMEKLEKTSMNFMQIINNKDFGFDKQIEELMPKTNKNIAYKDIEEIPTSPANKRAIWQSICVVKEIVKVIKCEPSNIYIEFARNEDEKRMKDNRAKQLIKKYEEIDKQLKYLKDYDGNVYKELKAHQNDKTLREKMYLYYIQNGKCMYSGKSLNIDNLSLYEVDHIIPQSYTKDDSIDNKALVLKEFNQRKKDSLLLADEIINGRSEWWKSLLEAGLISQSKFYKLIRRKMFETDTDREKFIQRQLVETRQITKYVTNLLNNSYKNTNIFAIRAELTHGFRQKYNIYKNRNVNNYHHAQDAYILSIIGNIIDTYWKGKGEFKYSDYVKKYYNDEKNKKEKYGMMMAFINKYLDIEKTKKTLNYKDLYISRMVEEETGAFYNQTIYSPNSNPSIPLKSNMEASKYGGYSGEIKAFSVVYKYTNKKGNVEYSLIGIPIKISYDIKNKKDSIEEYIKRTELKDIEYSNFEIILNRILKNQQYLDENNEPMRFCSDSEIRADKELILDSEMNKLIYKMNQAENMLEDDEKKELLHKYQYMYTYLINKIKDEYKVFESIYKKLKDKVDYFNSMTNEDKKATLNGLINLMETGQGNLKSMGLSDRAGRISGKKFKNEKLLKMTFINKSVTGMYERRIKINGVENCSNK